MYIYECSMRVSMLKSGFANNKQQKGILQVKRFPQISWQQHTENWDFSGEVLIVWFASQSKSTKQVCTIKLFTADGLKLFVNKIELSIKKFQEILAFYLLLNFQFWTLL